MMAEKIRQREMGEGLWFATFDDKYTSISTKPQITIDA